MKRRFVDLSIFLENEVLSDPPGFGPKTEYQDHQASAGRITSIFKGLQKDEFSDGEGWAVEQVRPFAPHPPWIQSCHRNTPSSSEAHRASGLRPPVVSLRRTRHHRRAH
jgi:hypothetical protein